MTAQAAYATYSWDVLLTALMRADGFRCEGPTKEEYESQIDGIDDEKDEPDEQAA